MPRSPQEGGKGWSHRRSSGGLQLFHRESGLNVLFDEVPIPPSEWAVAPRYVSIALTNACDLRCPYCYASKRAARLPTAALRQWLLELAAHECLGVGREDVDDLVPREDGSIPERRQIPVKAKWAPMVNEKLFRDVGARLNRRTPLGGGRQRRMKAHYPLTLTCAHCGLEYNGNRLKKEQGEARQYGHLNPKATEQPELHARKSAARCLAWSVDADELETKIKDLVLRERTSPEFVEEVRARIMERDERRKSAKATVEVAKRRLEEYESAYNRLARIAAGVGVTGTDEDALVKQLQDARQRITHAKADLAEAEAFDRSHESAMERLSKLIDKTKNLAAAWEVATVEERSTLLDYWVLEVLIVAEPIPGMKRANNKTALVWLRTDPETPRSLELGNQRPTSADFSSV
jgi:hypothetical protein